jgi:hypothetical protein
MQQSLPPSEEREGGFALRPACWPLLLLLLNRNHIRDVPKMVVVVVVTGVRHIAAVLGDHGVAGIHIEAGFGSAFEVNRSADINRKSFQESNHGTVGVG